MAETARAPVVQIKAPVSHPGRPANLHRLRWAAAAFSVGSRFGADDPSGCETGDQARLRPGMTSP